MGDTDEQRRRDGRRTDMRRQVLVVANELFATKGFRATSLREIAERLDVTKAALYYHFPRKADLVRAVVAPMVDDIDAWFEHAEASDAPVRDLLFDYFDVVHRHQDLLDAIGREPAAIDIPEFMERIATWVSRAQALLAGPDAGLEQRVRATVAITGLARSTNFFPHAPVDVLRETAVEAAYRALREDDGSAPPLQPTSAESR